MLSRVSNGSNGLQVQSVNKTKKVKCKGHGYDTDTETTVYTTKRAKELPFASPPRVTVNKTSHDS